jgi:predicted RNA-binding protein YlxR (DUF448 family)
MRTCIGCRAVLAQSALRRCVLTVDGTAQLSRTAPGRGAWLCSPECVTRAVKRNAFQRAWRRPVPSGALDGLDHSFVSTPDNMRESRSAGSAAGAPMPTKG